MPPASTMAPQLHDVAISRHLALQGTRVLICVAELMVAWEQVLLLGGPHLFWFRTVWPGSGHCVVCGSGFMQSRALHLSSTIHNCMQGVCVTSKGMLSGAALFRLSLP